MITLLFMLNSEIVDIIKNARGKKSIKVNNKTNCEFSSRNISLRLLAEEKTKLRQSTTQMALPVQKWKASMILRMWL